MPPKSETQPKTCPAARFWNRHADKYSRDPVKDETVYQTKLQHIRSLLGPDMEVMEFGCGTGSTALALAQSVKNLHATDISSRMIEIAQGKAETAGIHNVRFEVISFEAFQPAANGYDVVMGHSILHLLDDYAGAIAKVHAMLKPGGFFVSSTVCLDDDLKFLRLIAPVARLFGFMPPITFFTEEQLAEQVQQQGFTIEHQWKPAKRSGVFIVAKKTDSALKLPIFTAWKPRAIGVR